MKRLAIAALVGALALPVMTLAQQTTQTGQTETTPKKQKRSKTKKHNKKAGGEQKPAQ